MSIFLTLFFSRVKFSCWSKFDVSIFTGSWVWQFSFIRDWPEIRKSEKPLSEFCHISGDWGGSGIPNLARMSLIKCYCIMLNAKVTTLGKPTGWGLKLPPSSSPRLRLTLCRNVFPSKCLLFDIKWLKKWKFYGDIFIWLQHGPKG